MATKNPKPLINVKEGGANFRMVDCEFQMGSSDRPIIETKADNTQIESTKVTTTQPAPTPPSQWNRLVWKVFAPIVVAVAGGVLLYLLTAG